MLVKAVLLAAFACNAWASPYVITNPEDLKNDWHSNDYTATSDKDQMIHWKFTIEGHNAVPDPGDFSTVCKGVKQQLCGEACTKPGAFAPCKDKAYEARQWFNGHGTTVEVRRTTFPDAGKKVITSAMANITEQIVAGTVHYKLKFGDFQKHFISTFNPPSV
ncbi:hypothetical protein FGADI_9567 [Fusarium gaditjirri]|uniref:Uncharacterized protein n=1 Tax=Fusarium gaditjirri TaxID=282569 RepID=A0A8H4WSE0_9HYPO|nr:hypothetical protein FGADI_9567 [Fusarium gaditjirri]